MRGRVGWRRTDLACRVNVEPMVKVDPGRPAVTPWYNKARKREHRSVRGMTGQRKAGGQPARHASGVALGLARVPTDAAAPPTDAWRELDCICWP